MPALFTRERTPTEVFDIDQRMRDGWYTDHYFNNTQQLVAKLRPDAEVLMQVFQKKHAVLGGIDEALAILRECAGERVPLWPDHAQRPGWMAWANGWDQLEVRALYEADEIEPLEPVLTIRGPYRLFAHLETCYLGVLARRTRIATNVAEVIRAANGKPVMYFPARFDHWVNQTGDGNTAHNAGVVGVSTDAQASWWGGKGIGTVPHALIAAFDGDTVAAAVAYAREFGRDTNVSVLVDFDNDCSSTAVAVARAFASEGLKLWGVRLDTSESMVDWGLVRQGLGQYKPNGVCPELVRLVRETLDICGYGDVRIIVSGGFTPEKIRAFEAAEVPVDSYGVGESLLGGSFPFTADIVQVNGQPCAKEGRKEIPSDRLELVT